ncbi:MAG: efflux transporter outer membrane subunit [Pseudomonadales bacterium]|nr:efflux transporter outer membrane subunit [Pseudomonadales bacterium]
MKLWPFLPMVLLSGCMLGPNYERPETPGIDSWHIDTAYQETGSASVRDLDWSEIFNDEQLKTAIAAALENNRDMLLAIERIQEARATARIARSGIFPTFDLDLHGEREAESGLTNDPAETADQFTFAAAMAWEMDIWGKQRRTNSAAFAEYLAAEYGAQAVRLSLIADVALAYFELQGLESRLDINKRTLIARERALEIAEKRHKGGLTSKLEVIQSDVEVAATRSQIPQVEQSKLVVENQLSLLMGLPPTHLAMARDLEDHFIPESVTAGLASDLLERRPDIMQTEQNLIAASERVGAAKAALFPSFQLTGSLGYETEDFDGLLDSDGNAWILELDVVQPLFYSGARRAQLSAAESRFNQARLAYQKTVLEAFQETSNALNQFHKSTETLNALSDLERSSAEYLRLAEKRYRNGVLAYIDVLDARRQLFDAQISVSQARQEQLFALVNLYKAVGGGWNPKAISEIAESR